MYNIDRNIMQENKEILNMEGEEWRDISDYEGVYQISNKGRVKSLGRAVICNNWKRHTIDKILNPQGRDKNAINLRTNGKNYSFPIKTLVNKIFGFEYTIPDLEGEIWKDIKNWEGYYQVSNLGRVKSLTRTKQSDSLGRKRSFPEKIIKPTLNFGYLKVGLWKFCKSKLFNIHKLVAEAFISNPYNLLEIHHKDNNPLNNKMENLQWIDRNEHIKISIKNRKLRTDFKKVKKQPSKKNILPSYYTDKNFNPSDEIWKNVEGYNLYKISNYGRLLSFQYKVNQNGRFIKPQFLYCNNNRNGNYLYYHLYNNKKHKIFTSHRLVALHFVPNPENRPQVNNKDGKKTNNHESNLCWNTSKQNILHSHKLGLANTRGETCHLSKLTEKQVIKIRELKLKGLSTMFLCKNFNMSRTAIKHIVNRKTWKHI